MANRVVDRDLGWARIREAVAGAGGQGGAHVKVGVLGGGEEGGLHSGAPLTVGEIALVNEFGTEDGRIPARSFVRSTFDAQRPALEETTRRLARGILSGAVDVTRALGVLGAMLAAEIKKTVTTGTGVPPPNAPATVRAKGSARPLVDTGRMIGAVTWAIVAGRPRE